MTKFYPTIQAASAAAIALGINTNYEYKEHYQQDPRMPSDPSRVYAEDWQNFGRWVGFLGNKVKDFYPTIQEASAAAIALGISTNGEYRANYKQDPRLPSTPSQEYAADWQDFGGVVGFLGNKVKDFYPTIQEASAAVIALGISTNGEYRANYKQDPRLPSTPSQEYAADLQDFGGWVGFLPNKVKAKDFYPTIQEASAAAITLGISTNYEYKANYKRDPRLPSNPSRVYAADWQDFGRWVGFFGDKVKDFYPTIQEASAAAITLEINTSSEYKENYQQDPRLPSVPSRVYTADWQDFGGWFGFLGNKVKVKDFYPTIQEASAAAIALGSRSISQYLANYKQDPRLLSNPNRMYAADWQDFGRWVGFLGNKVKDFYPTIQEASDAAIALGSRSISEYIANYKQDPHLPSAPSQVYAADWQNFGGWVGFLRNKVIVKDFYPTIQEASAAVIALGISTGGEYITNYQQDPRLPSSPSQEYAADWQDFGLMVGFLGNKVKDFYPTIQEASDAAIALGTSTISEYLANYKQDPRLPSTPSQEYAADWQNFDRWVGFLGNKGKSFYPTIQEASDAAKALGCITISEYMANYKQDPRLPSNPTREYAADWQEFGGRAAFLGNKVDGFYPTIQEASAAVIALGISTNGEYRANYKQDPRLPSNPHTVYAAGWQGFGGRASFLGNERRLTDKDITEDYKAWKELYISFTNEISANLSLKIRTVREFICSFIITNKLPKRPEDYLLRTVKFDRRQYEDFVTSRFKGKKKSMHHVALVEFLQYCLVELCTFNDGDEQIIHPDYCNPLQNFRSEKLDIAQTRLDESNKPVLAYSYMVSAREWIIPPSATSIGNLIHLQDVTEMDWFDVQECSIDKNDPDCVYRKVNKESRIDRKHVDVWQIWSPVRFLALYTLLKVPARGQQILWCDSGEADNLVPEFIKGKVEWHANTGPLAKFSKKNQQGFIKQYNHDEIGLHFTTNKTSRTEGGFNVPWVPEDLAYWMIKLRKWQAQYNPISEPTRWRDLTKLRSPIATSVLDARGCNCFLFRQANNTNPFGQPIFAKVLPYVLHQIEKKDNPLTTELNDRGTLNSYTTEYTPHSMRVSLITAFVVDAKVPLEIVQKLVGHARIVMTIYYTKVGLAQIRDELSSGEKRALAQAPFVIQQQIRNKQIETIKNSLTANNSNYLDGLSNQYPSSAYSFTDIGICPMGGGRCSTGGKLNNDNYQNKVYLPVEAGHLGMANCIRCRFFITGPAYLGGLSAVANEIYLKQQYVQQKERSLLIHISKLVDEEYDCEKNHEVFPHAMELEKSNTHLENLSQKIDMYAIDGVHLIRLIDKSKILLNQSIATGDSTTENVLIANTQAAQIEWSLDETNSEFHQLSTVCENATIYAIADDSLATPRRTILIDKMVRNNGIEPGMYLLSPEEQLAVGNQMSALLIDRLKSWEAVENLMQGHLYLDDLDDLCDVPQKPIKEELKRLMIGGGNKKLNKP